MTGTALAMTPLDLNVTPPRQPRAALDGLTFLPRSIDKVRSRLPGGEPGAFNIAGLTQLMLDTLGIPLDAFSAAVADAANDDAVAAYVRAHAAPGAPERWNAIVAAREPRNGNRSEALTVYPWLAERPDLVLVLDVLEEDDHRHFAAPR
jgi:hypothetical protein